MSYPYGGRPPAPGSSAPMYGNIQQQQQPPMPGQMNMQQQPPGGMGMGMHGQMHGQMQGMPQQPIQGYGNPPRPGIGMAPPGSVPGGPPQPHSQPASGHMGRAPQQPGMGMGMGIGGPPIPGASGPMPGMGGNPGMTPMSQQAPMMYVPGGGVQGQRAGGGPNMPMQQSMTPLTPMQQPMNPALSGVGAAAIQSGQRGPGAPGAPPMNLGGGMGGAPMSGMVPGGPVKAPMNLGGGMGGAPMSGMVPGGPVKPAMSAPPLPGQAPGMGAPPLPGQAPGMGMSPNPPASNAPPAPGASVPFFSVGGNANANNAAPAPGMGMGAPGMGMGAPGMGMGAPGMGMGGPPGPMQGIGGPPTPKQQIDGISNAFGGMYVSGPVGGPGAYQQYPATATGQPMPGTPGTVPGASGGDPLPNINEVDLSIQCDPRYMRFTVAKIPNSQSTAASLKLPLGVIIQPMALDVKGETNIEVVNFGLTNIVRCKRCRTYINPYVSWLDNGRRWRCNVCGVPNEVPSTYFSHLDQNGQRRDKDQRPELNSGSVELVAPNEYMVRPPQPPVYMFLIDVSSTAMASGMVACCVESIKRSLDELPGDPRTQVGIITYDTTVHFYNLRCTLNSPQMFVVPDITDIYKPLPDDLLVNLKDSKELIETLLDQLPSMHAKNQQVDTCMGPALTAAYMVMGQIGGKICVFQSSLPSLGEGSLKTREDVRALGTDREHTILSADDSWYRAKAVEFSRQHCCVDMFLFASQYCDVATLSVLPKFTGGNLYHYPAFSPNKDGEKFKDELYRLLTQPTGFEAVMRVRATRGLRVTNFYGNYLIKGNDLLALPNCSPDCVYGVELALDETFLTASVICVQTALLYTTSDGERRIRVHTIAAPVSNIIQDIVNSIDMEAMCNLIAKRNLEIALKSGFDASRQKFQSVCMEAVRACRQVTGPGQQYSLPDSIKFLPLYSMAMQKNIVFRGGSEIRTDLRALYIFLLNAMPVEVFRFFIYPRMFGIHNMSNEAGRPSRENAENKGTAGKNQIVLPRNEDISLSAECLKSDGIFLLENGLCIYLWVGKMVNPAILSQLFGVNSLDGVDTNELRLQDHGNDLSSRVHNIITALREERPRFLQVNIVREGSNDLHAFMFYWHLVEDRASFQGGSFTYGEYLNLISRQSFGM